MKAMKRGISSIRKVFQVLESIVFFIYINIA